MARSFLCEVSAHVVRHLSVKRYAQARSCDGIALSVAAVSDRLGIYDAHSLVRLYQGVSLLISCTLRCVLEHGTSLSL